MPRYFEVPELNTAIFDIEANIVVHEAIVTRQTKKEEEVRRASKTRESRRCSARDMFAQEEAGKEKEKSNKKRKQDERQRSENDQDLVDRITKIKLMTSNAPLTSTPAGQFSERKSMNPISSRIGAPSGGGDGNPDDSDDESDYDDEDEEKGRRNRDTDDGSRRNRDDDRSGKRKRSRSRSRDTRSKRRRSSSRVPRGRTAVPKMPNLDPRNYYWYGNMAFLHFSM